MTKLYLITGFLGAGKTTFLHDLVRLFPDRRLAIVVNEFGKVGVDGVLLSDLEAELVEINNGSIFCSCRIEQFEDGLSSLLALAQPPEIIFVEASGLSDPTAVRLILSQGGKFDSLEYAGAICLLDAARFQKVWQTARVCRMQLAIADLVLINKRDLASPEQLSEIRAAAVAQKPGRPVHETSFGRIEPQWLEEMERPLPEDGQAEIHTRDITLQKLTLELHGFDLGSAEAFLKMFAGDAYRVKGLLSLPEGLYLADCVGPLVELRPFAAPDSGPAPEADRLAVLFGNGLPAKKSIRAAVPHFPGCTVEIL